MPANPGRFPRIFLFAPEVRRFVSYARPTQALSSRRYGSGYNKQQRHLPQHLQRMKPRPSLPLTPCRPDLHAFTVSNYLLVWRLLSTDNIGNANPLSEYFYCSICTHQSKNHVVSESFLSFPYPIHTHCCSIEYHCWCLSTRCYGNPKRSKRSNP